MKADSNFILNLEQYLPQYSSKIVEVMSEVLLLMLNKPFDIPTEAKKVLLIICEAELEEIEATIKRAQSELAAGRSGVDREWEQKPEEAGRFGYNVYCTFLTPPYSGMNSSLIPRLTSVDFHLTTYLKQYFTDSYLTKFQYASCQFSTYFDELSRPREIRFLLSWKHDSLSDSGKELDSFSFQLVFKYSEDKFLKPVIFSGRDNLRAERDSDSETWTFFRTVDHTQSDRPFDYLNVISTYSSIGKVRLPVGDAEIFYTSTSNDINSYSNG